MNERIRVIEKEQKILFLDLSGLDTESILKLFKEFTETAIRMKIVKFILDVSDTRTSDEIKNGSMESIKAITAANGQIKTSLIGLRGIQKIIANAISPSQYFAKDQEDAIRWLFK
jgi:hypothetical protein